MRAVEHQYPTAPLVESWRESNPPHLSSFCTCTIVDPETGKPEGFCASTESLARKVGVSHSTIHRRLREGWITADEADEWAAAIGVPPHALWWDRWGSDCEEPDPVIECGEADAVGADIVDLIEWLGDGEAMSA
jgi:lambda repressor-like predicted transcriptional regulator